MFGRRTRYYGLDKYVGEFKGDYRDGYMVNGDNVLLNGYFKDGKCIDTSNQMTAELYYKIIDKNRLKYEYLILENGASYIGSRKDNLRHGYGMFISKDKTTFIGEWKNNNLNSKAIVRYNNGKEYVGGFYQGEYQGMGMCINYKGSRSKYIASIGKWKNSERNGLFVEYFHDGNVIKEYYENDEKNKDIIVSKDKDLLLQHFKNGVEHGESYFVSNESRRASCGTYINGVLQEG